MLVRLTRRTVLTAVASSLLFPAGALAETKKKVSAASLKLTLDVARQLSLPAGLPKGVAQGVGAIVAKLKSDPAGAKKAWVALIEKHGKGLDEARVLALSRWLARESVLEPAVELAAAADRARFFTDKRSAVESQLAVMRKLKSKGPPYAVHTLTLTQAYAKAAPASKLAAVSTKMDSKAFAAKQKELEEQLATLDDDAQLANVDLQNTLQKQQQTLQMLSNISKMLYDAATSVIRKMGG